MRPVPAPATCCRHTAAFLHQTEDSGPGLGPKGGPPGSPPHLLHPAHTHTHTHTLLKEALGKQRLILFYSRTHSRARSTCSRNVCGMMGIVNENLAQFSKQQEQVKTSGDPGCCLPGEAVVFSPTGCGILGPSLRSNSQFPLRF